MFLVLRFVGWGLRLEPFCFNLFFEDFLRHTLPVEAIILTDYRTVAAPPHIGWAVWLSAE